MKHFLGLIIVSGNSLLIVAAVNHEIKREMQKFCIYAKTNFHSIFRSFMPSDASENPAALTSMTTVTDDNNHASSSTSMMITTGNHIQSPPLSSAIQSQTSTVIRSNSPVQVSSKQLDKLRSFLSTLYYFGLDISSEIGEHVRALILALIVSFYVAFRQEYDYMSDFFLKTRNLFFQCFCFRITLYLSKNFMKNYKRRQIFH